TWSWDAVTGANSYKVYNGSGGSLLATVTAPTVQYTRSPLTNNTQYTAVVRAYSTANGTGIESSAVSAYTNAAAVQDLTHSTNTTSSITWAWDDDGQEAFYARDKNNVTDNSGWITGNSWVQTGLSANTAYTVEVKAKNASDVQTSYSEITRYTSQNVPSGLTFSSIGRTQVMVTADGTFPNQGVGSASLEFDNGAEVTQSVTSGSDWINENLNAGTEYTYTVYAKNGDGDVTTSVEGAVTTQSGSSVPHETVVTEEQGDNNDNGQVVSERTCTELQGTSQRNRYCFVNMRELFDYLNNLVRVSRMHPEDYLDFNRDGEFNLRDMVEFIRR
ncbi:MAG: hypothetical protein V1908_01870, partial [Candidatus Peregrinibacteria bacterium]